jgi:hypothetical protein
MTHIWDQVLVASNNYISMNPVVVFMNEDQNSIAHNFFVILSCDLF